MAIARFVSGPAPRCRYSRVGRRYGARLKARPWMRIEEGLAWRGQALPGGKGQEGRSLRSPGWFGTNESSVPTSNLRADPYLSAVAPLHMCH